MDKKKETITILAECCGYSAEDVFGKSRASNIMLVKQTIWLLLHREKISLKSIAILFSRSSPSILSGIRHIEGLLEIKDFDACECYGRMLTMLGVIRNEQRHQVLNQYARIFGVSLTELISRDRSNRLVTIRFAIYRDLYYNDYTLEEIAEKFGYRKQSIHNGIIKIDNLLFTRDHNAIDALNLIKKYNYGCS